MVDTAKLWSRHVATSMASIRASSKYMRHHSLTPNEWRRYYSKSVSLSLTYLAFCSDLSLKQAAAAGEAAFLCCSYDVFTDWRGDPLSGLSVFDTVLQLCDVPPSLKNLARSLYEKELSGNVKRGGLERGALALEFVSRYIGSYDFLQQRIDVHEFGVACQVVDDLLDYESDNARGDLNFVGSPGWIDELEAAKQLLRSDQAESLYRRGPLLRTVVRRAFDRAMLLRHGHGMFTQHETDETLSRLPRKATLR